MQCPPTPGILSTSTSGRANSHLPLQHLWLGFRVSGGNRLRPPDQGKKGPSLRLALEAAVTGMKVLWVWGTGEGAATWELRHVFSAGRDRQGDGDWLGCSWSCHSSLGFLDKTLILHPLPEFSAIPGHQAAGSLPMLVDEVLVVARTAVV